MIIFSFNVYDSYFCKCKCNYLRLNKKFFIFYESYVEEKSSGACRCEVPEARLSVNGKTGSLDEVYFNTQTREHSPLGEASLYGWSPVLQGCIRLLHLI